LAEINSRERSQSETIKPSSFNQTHIKKLKSLNNCKKCNLSGANLSREKLKGADMAEANLSYANLSLEAYLQHQRGCRYTFLGQHTSP
jgi:uncharacterized protein YjbI with pentapeptide repeats